MSDAEEIAKAVQSVAQTGEVAIETTRSLGGFLARVFQEPTEEVVGMLTDKLRFVRWKRMVRMSDEVKRILDDRGVVDTRPVPPKLALPIFEESSLEEDDELHQLWCNLLANAMDPDFDGDIRSGFMDILKSLNVIDIRILDFMYGRIQPPSKRAPVHSVQKCAVTGHTLIENLGIDADTYLVSLSNLNRVQCVERRFGVSFAPNHDVTLTPLGLRFVEACVHSLGKDQTNALR